MRAATLALGGPTEPTERVRRWLWPIVGQLIVAFFRYRIIPRMLVDTTARDTSIELFGRKLSAPICFSPVGINKACS